jgi:hypothetical protein
MLNQEIEAALLDRDGSCRDLNFEHPSWRGVQALVTRLRSEFADVSVGGTSADTDTHSVGDPDEGLSSVRTDGGSVQLLFNRGQDLLSQLQLFVHFDGVADLFVELTFFPQDVARLPNLGHRFREWVMSICELLEAVRAYARYEDASWTFGDTGPSSGVFLVLPPNAA